MLGQGGHSFDLSVEDVCCGAVVGCGTEGAWVEGILVVGDWDTCGTLDVGKG